MGELRLVERPGSVRSEPFRITGFAHGRLLANVWLPLGAYPGKKNAAPSATLDCELRVGGCPLSSDASAFARTRVTATVPAPTTQGLELFWVPVAFKLENPCPPEAPEREEDRVYTVRVQCLAGAASTSGTWMYGRTETRDLGCHLNDHPCISGALTAFPPSEGRGDLLGAAPGGGDAKGCDPRAPPRPAAP